MSLCGCRRTTRISEVATSSTPQNSTRCWAADGPSPQTISGISCWPPRKGHPCWSAMWRKSEIGAAPPQGATLRNGETVSGTVIMLKGGNGKELIERVKAKIAGLHLPEGIKIAPFYDQSFVIDGTIHTVEKNLFEGFILSLAVSRQHQGRDHHRFDHSVFHAHQFSRHAPLWNQRQLDESGRHRFRHDCRRRGRDAGDLRPSAGREAPAGAPSPIGEAEMLPR